jgi:hypothetical protein
MQKEEKIMKLPEEIRELRAQAELEPVKAQSPSMLRNISLPLLVAEMNLAVEKAKDAQACVTRVSMYADSMLEIINATTKLNDELIQVFRLVAEFQRRML